MKTINLGRFASRIILSNFRQLDYPYKLNIMVTNRCNQQCTICRIWENEPEEIPLEQIRRFFNKSNSFSWIDVSGGEIFLRPDILEVFSIITGNCRNLSLLHFATNGSMTDEIIQCTSEIRRMGRYKLVVTVSVDGPPQVHDTLRDTEGAFERALKTYVGLKNIRGCDVYLGMTLSAENTGMYQATLEACQKRAPWVTPRDIHVNIAHASTHYGNLGSRVSRRYVSMDRDIEAILSSRKGGIQPQDLVERRYLKHAASHMSTGGSPIPCRALSASCFVDCDGQVYPCVSWDQSVGSILETDGDLKPIWEGTSAAKARHLISRNYCPGCWTPCEAVPAILGGFGPSPVLRNSPVLRST